MKNPYLPIEAKIEKVIAETPNIKTFVLKPKEEIPFATGQFVEITVPGIGEAPFTPSSSPYLKEKIEITIMDVGRVTNKLHQMAAGEIVGIRGPYGKGYPLDKMYGKEVLILGGGVGMAPLRSFLLALLEEADKFKRIVLCYGAKTPEDIVYKGQFVEWVKDKNLEVYRSVDKADSKWKETEGVVTVLLDKFKMNLENSVAIVCGPPIMMKFGTKRVLELGHRPENIYLSMEKNMSCGVGKCGHCALGRFYVCKDGPVFSYEQIKETPEIWD
ncbi:MAG: FAD/NAD(P)-binding protein [Candidatus Omnitrophica bacterium]|nr:FAD/NAD(P)-binding protein [Candidatus Omnitrophota bacterium]